MISAEMWNSNGYWFAKIGYSYYRWNAGEMKWIGTFWLCDHHYERAKGNGCLITSVKIRLSTIKL